MNQVKSLNLDEANLKFSRGSWSRPRKNSDSHANPTGEHLEALREGKEDPTE